MLVSHNRSHQLLALLCRGQDIALDIARGLQYLHEKMEIVHLDVKSPNVLLTNMRQAKVADVGLARVLGKKRCLSKSPLQGTTAGVKAGPAILIKSSDNVCLVDIASVALHQLFG